MIAISIGELSKETSKYLNVAAYGNERVVVTCHGKPKVAIVSMDDYEALQLVDHLLELADHEEDI